MVEFTNNPSEKSQPSAYQSPIDEPFNERLNNKLEKMESLTNKLALIADMMSFQPGQHTEAWNDSVVEFLMETQACVTLVRNHKEQAHCNMVVALLMILTVLGGFFLLGGYFFVQDVLY